MLNKVSQRDKIIYKKASIVKKWQITPDNGIYEMTYRIRLLGRKTDWSRDGMWGGGISLKQWFSETDTDGVSEIEMLCR